MLFRTAVLLTKAILLTGLVLAVSAIGTTEAVANAGGTERPYRGGGTGTAVTIRTGPLTFTGSAYGEEIKSHLGRSTYRTPVQYSTVIDPDTLLQSAPKTVITAANGDKLFTSQTGTAAFTPACLGSGEGCVITSLLDSMIIGGTGRFEDATGSTLITTRAVRTAIDGATSTYSTRQRFEGTLSY
jgi:hypothetical protein